MLGGLIFLASAANYLYSKYSSFSVEIVTRTLIYLHVFQTKLITNIVLIFLLSSITVKDGSFVHSWLLMWYSSRKL